MWFAQEHANTCAVAALRSVLATQCGVVVPERVLEALGTIARYPIREHGTTGDHLRRMVREANRAFNAGTPWRMRYRRRGSVAQLRRWCQRGVYPMVRVWDVDDLHMVVVKAVRSRGVVYFDPSDGREHTRTTERFLAWWRDRELTWYAVILPEDS